MNSPNRTPDWLGIGGGRSGTSWLIANLHEHPEVCSPADQLNYFHRDDRYGRGLDWYAGHWAEAEAGQSVGECSDAYLYSDVAMKRIAADCPGVRLFMSARNPVMRTRSAVRLGIMQGHISPDTPIQEALQKVPQALEFSLYGKYAERYVDTFTRDRMHIAVLDFDNPSGFDPDPPLEALYRFIGVDESFRSQFANRAIGHAFVPRSVLVEKLMLNTSRFLDTIGLTRVRWWIKSSGLPGMLRRYNDQTNQKQNADVSNDDVEYLLDRLHRDIERFQKLVDVDLEAMWIKPLRSDR